MRVFSRHAVQALFLQRQHLSRPRARRLTPGRLTRFVEDVGGVQMDSINVLERAHYLTVWSRFGPYDRARLDRLVYRRRLLPRVLGARRLPGAHLDAAVVAARDARLPRAAYRLVRLAAQATPGCSPP